MLPTDQPMVLGDHLDELRRRLVRVILVVFGVMVISMFFASTVLDMVLQPLERAAQMVDEEALVHLKVESRDELAVLHNKSLTEGPVSVIRIAFYLAIVVAIPMILYELWGFITPGLTPSERRFAFMLVPLAAIFFYAGLVFGYLVGLPFLYKMIIEFNASFNSGVKYTIFQSDYYSFFFMMCLLFGLLMDVPWAVMLLVRTGIVTPDQLAAKRKLIYFVAIIAAALFTPPDPYSQMMVWGLAAILFEAGLLASRVMYKRLQPQLERMDQEDDDLEAMAAYVSGHDAQQRGAPTGTESPGHADPAQADEHAVESGHDDWHDDPVEQDGGDDDEEEDDDDQDDGPVSRRTGWDGPEGER